MKIRSLVLAAVLGLCTLGGLAQSSKYVFEVASIKPSSSGRPGTSIQTGGGRFKAINASVSFLIQYAYGLKNFQLTGGPGWVASDPYDIDAKSAIKAEVREFPSMMQRLLADRFQLKVHRETKELPVFELGIAKNGSKLIPASDIDTASQRNGRGQLMIRKGTMAGLASTLSNILGQKVLDKTGLKGAYDITLKWAPDETQSAPLRPDAAPADLNGPSIFTAVQEQLGLKLESAKGPVEVFVIDSVQKPTEN